jgi:hypothetical protein
VDVYDSDYRRQYCQEHSSHPGRYRRAQVQPADSQRRIRVVVQVRSIVQCVRQQVPRREPAYRS